MLNKITRFLWHIDRSLASYVVLNQMASLLFCFGQSPETSNMQLHYFDSFLGQRICPFFFFFFDERIYPFILCYRVL